MDGPYTYDSSFSRVGDRLASVVRWEMQGPSPGSHFNIGPHTCTQGNCAIQWSYAETE